MHGCAGVDVRRYVHSGVARPHFTAMGEGVELAISVADEGRVVAPERLPHLFRKHGGIAGGGRIRAASSGEAGPDRVVVNRNPAPPGRAARKTNKR